MISLKQKLLAAVIFSSLMTGCGSDHKSATTEKPTPDTPKTNPEAMTPEVEEITTFKIGLLPDTQGGSDAAGQSHVSMHPMKQLLEQQSANDVNLVLALGDLTDGGSDVEFAEWRSVAEQYQAQGIEFLPVMGNHESSYAYTYNWIKNMKDFIPEDAVHMVGYEWINYYIVRDNVLIFGLAYYNLPVAFEWIKTTVESLDDRIEHIVVASHDGLIGAKYGQTLEQIVDGTKDDNWVYDVQPQIRDFFAERDVIYVQGHEHQYQRSLISAKTTLETLPSSSTPTGGNYRMDAYTQIIAGNASYKGYEFRFGEREKVQMIVSQKNSTKNNGSTHYDVNSSILSFTGPLVDFKAYYAPHTATSNNDDQNFTADWHLFDKFTRTTNRCGTVVYSTSISEDIRPVLVLQPEYLTNECYADDGSYVTLAGGENNTFNRTNTRTRDLGYTAGFTRAETLTDLARLAYQWLFQMHERWTPNLNSAERIVPDGAADELIIPETTIDLKEHVTTSWLAANSTLSDIVIISGTQNQTGMYQSDYGSELDIEVDAGLANSQTDGTAKQAVVLPATATKSWDISNAVSDAYALEFVAPNSIDASTSQLGIYQNNEWQAVSTSECVVDAPWSKAYLTTAPIREPGCEAYPLVGYDSNFGNKWWVVLDKDAQLALITL
jgi:hypothetical protein|tara:strand:+ start:1881 stop:3869 length:1989 start_codon:yes stop_codon:yes gene_type:complete